MHEFSPQLAEDEVRDAVSVQKISRMHFASAAAWWKPAPHNEHAHGPGRVADVENWVRCSMNYVNAELGRLQTD
jgi:hypothetical protein